MQLSGVAIAGLTSSAFAEINGWTSVSGMLWFDWEQVQWAHTSDSVGIGNSYISSGPNYVGDSEHIAVPPWSGGAIIHVPDWESTVGFNGIFYYKNYEIACNPFFEPDFS